MDFKIQNGIFKFDLVDHYAVLGVAIDTSSEQIRKHYLKIARRLHPDKCKDKSDAEKQFATKLFSKLVCPAYETLYSDKSRTEYHLVLEQVKKRLGQEGANIQLQSELAKQLAQAGSDLERGYQNSLQNLAAHQYESFSDILNVTGEISELNMVYLMRKAGEASQKPVQSIATATSTQQAPPPQPVSQKVEQPSIVEPYCRRAEDYMAKGNFARAILELRDALQLDPNHSRSHGLLGMAYLRQNQGTMAKIHVNKALQLNPKDENALKAKQELDKLGQKTTPSSKPTSSKPTGVKPDDKSSGGGLFGGLFGGKKK